SEEVSMAMPSATERLRSFAARNTPVRKGRPRYLWSAILNFEASHRAPQFGRQLGELSDRDVGLLGAFGGLLGDLQDALHPAGDVRHRRRLLLSLRGDAADKLRELARHPTYFVQRLPRRVGKLRAFNHPYRTLLHGGDGVLRIGLNRFHDRIDLF